MPGVPGESINMANSLSEGFARITYNGATGAHHAIVPINFAGTPVPGVAPSLTTKGATSVGAEVGIGEFLDVYRANFYSTTLFGLVEIYAVDPDTEERTFIYGFDASRAGSSGGVPVVLGMATTTFKTVGGGVLKIVMMESVSPVNTKFYPPFDEETPIGALVEYVVSDASIVIGRDDEVAFAPISFTSKTSDALRKRAGLA